MSALMQKGYFLTAKGSCFGEPKILYMLEITFLHITFPSTQILASNDWAAVNYGQEQWKETCLKKKELLTCVSQDTY